MFRYNYLFLLFVILYKVSCYCSLTEETVYLTWQGDPATTMTIQWVSGYQEKQTEIVYSPLSQDRWSKATGETLPFPQAPQYLIHRVELKNLQPDSNYRFKVTPYNQEYRFITAPAKLEKELRFVVGGDMYHDGIELLIKTNQAAANTNPLFAALGGDIAYSVKSVQFGFQEIERWIDWVKAWHTYMITPKGNLVPVISAIGNHDLNGGFGQTPDQAAIFAALFPMPGKQVYSVLDFDSYLSLFILDSGHANSIEGKQSDWLKQTLEDRKHILHRFAIYHVPAYPSVRDYNNTYSDKARAFWVPIFEKGGIQIAFEHHDHAYKRTHPLLQGKIHPNGIVYFGDGGWGVEHPRIVKWSLPHLAKTASERHFIAVTLTSTDRRFKSINDRGEVIDEYQQKLTTQTKTDST